MVQGNGYGNIVLFVLFVMLPITYSFPFAEYILIVSILFLSLPFAYLITKRTGPVENQLKKIILAFSIYILWMILMIPNSEFSANTFIRMVQILGCMFAFVNGAVIVFHQHQLTYIRRIVQGIIIVSFVHWLILGAPLQNYSFIYSNTATYGSILFCWILFLFMQKNKRPLDLIVLLLGVALLLFSSTRSALVAIMFYAVISVIIKYRLKRKGQDKVFLNLLFLATIVGCVIFVFIYTESGYTELGMKINQLSIMYFGKNLYSGRQIIWHELIQAIEAHPVTGYGLDTLPNAIFNTHLSAHNTFLQVALQCGLVGMILLVNILRKISKAVISNRDYWYAAMGIACIISIIIHECFEACLVQNMLVVGLQMWFLMGLIINNTAREDDIYE